MSLPALLSPATTPQDYHQIAALENRVFYDEPFSIVAFGPERGSESNIENRAKELARQGSVRKEGVVVKAVLRGVDGEEGEGEVVGAAGWKFVGVWKEGGGEEWGESESESVGVEEGNKGDEGGGEEKDELGEEKDNVWGVGANVKFCEDIFLVGDAHMVRSTGGRDYAKLTALIVSPEHQRRGIGTQLLQAGLAQVDEMGLQCVLAASREGLDLYKRFGFVEFETMRLRLWEYEGGEGLGEDCNIIMWRPARGEHVGGQQMERTCFGL